MNFSHLSISFYKVQLRMCKNTTFWLHSRGWLKTKVDETNLNTTARQWILINYLTREDFSCRNSTLYCRPFRPAPSIIRPSKILPPAFLFSSLFIHSKKGLISPPLIFILEWKTIGTRNTIADFNETPVL